MNHISYLKAFAKHLCPNWEIGFLKVQVILHKLWQKQTKWLFD